MGRRWAKGEGRWAWAGIQSKVGRLSKSAPPSEANLVPVPKLSSKPTTQSHALAGPDGLADASSDRQFSTNLARGLDVLRAFTAAEPVLTNRALSDRTGLPKATVSRLTYTLTLYGYLVQEESGAYRLGTGFLALSHPILASLPIRQLARPFLDTLAAQTGFTVNLAIPERVKAIYIDTVRADLFNPYLPDIGRVSPLLQSAIGRALILGHSPAEKERLLNRIKVSEPESFETGISLLEDDETLFAENGYCRARGPWLADIDAIAVLLPLPSRMSPVAINCSVATSAPHAARLPDAVGALKDTARQIGNACIRSVPDRL
jgi:DNA-binding IclR family transcriptional regulator